MHRHRAEDLDGEGWSALLVGAVVPRPIAWITTRSAAGVVNLAPFSFVNVVTARPPTVAVAIAHRDPVKDTLANLLATGEAVVHPVPPGLGASANASSAPYPADVGEADALGLDLAPLPPLAVPRLQAADIALGCRLDRVVPVGEPVTSLLLLTVVVAEIASGVATARGLPDPARVRAWARLGGDAWLGPDGWQVHCLPRPTWAPHATRETP